MPSKKVIVVGGGLSGLNAAHTLQKAGFSVRVLECSQRPGGRVCTVRRGGYVIDVGADAMTQAYETYLSTVRELGLGDCIVSSSQVIGVARGGRVYDIDLARPLSAIRTAAISWRAKLAIVCAIRKTRAQLKGIDSFELVESAGRDNPKVTAKEFGESLFGVEVTDFLIDPVVRLTSGTGAAGCSMLAAIAPLASWTASMISMLGGLDTIPNALATRVPIEYGADVIGVVDSANNVTVTYRDASNETHVECGDYCVIATLFDTACQIWSPLATFMPGFGSSLEYVKLISISLGYDHLCNSKAYAVLIPTREHPDLLLGFLQHNKAPDRAPAGHSLLTFYTDTRATDRMLEWSDERLERWAADFAETAFPELKGYRKMCQVTRWPQAGYLAAPGFWQRARQLLDAIPINGRVQLAGDLFGAGSQESAMRWGQRAAKRIVSAAAMNSP